MKHLLFLEKKTNYLKVKVKKRMNTLKVKSPECINHMMVEVSPPCMKGSKTFSNQPSAKYSLDFGSIGEVRS